MVDAARTTIDEQLIAAARDLVVRTTKASGVPEHLEDPATVEQVANMLAAP